MRNHLTWPGGERGAVRVALAAAAAVALALTSAGAAHAAAPAHATQAVSASFEASLPGTFVSLDPVRLLDTRVGNGAAKAPVAANATVSLQITGRGGVPATGVSAVVMNVTVTGPSAGGFITVYPSGTSQPTASNLNFAPGQTIPNLTTVKVGADGKINLTNNSPGSAQLIADVAGYYLAGTPTEPGAFVSLDPVRLLDTRVGNGAPKAKVAAGATVSLQITGRSGVPETGVSAVVMNVTVTGPSAGGFITVYPSGTSQPTASNLNFAPGQTIPNLATVKVGAGGKINLTNNSARSADLIADVAGYYLAGTPTAAGAFVSLDPVRLLDTRYGVNSGTFPLESYWEWALQVTDRGGIPDRGVAAVVANVTATGPTASGFVTVHPWASEQPTASNLNFSTGQTIPNLVIAKVGHNGSINLVNNSLGSLHLIADAAGYFIADPLAPNLVWPYGWIFDDCGTDWDALLLLATPGLSFAPSTDIIEFEGESYYEFLPDESGTIVVTASPEPDYVISLGPETRWVMNPDDSATATYTYTNEWCG